ncbi:MAG TPA: hypothetical protein VN950_13285 [Terriglobales bacterium]|nr:hypothetical protein [Terriglobales bacterium]
MSKLRALCLCASLLVFPLCISAPSQRTDQLLSLTSAPNSSLFVNPWMQSAKLSGTSYPVYLGTSVAISADTAVASSLYSDLNKYTGAAYVFVRPATGWSNTTQTAALTSSDGKNCDLLGTSVAISADTIAIGAPQNGCNPGGPGEVYVFVKPAGGWSGVQTETAKLIASDGNAFDALGTSVSISGDTIVAGAPGTYPSSTPGAAYVFVKPEGGWKSGYQTAKLTSSDGRAGNELGYSVSISKDTVATGAPQAGVAYVFVKPTNGWKNATQTAELSSSDGAFNGELGYSISVDGQTVAAGAPYATVGPNQYQGDAYVFVEPSGGWRNMTETAKLTEGDGEAGDLLGSSIATSGSLVVAGAAQYSRGPSLKKLGGPSFLVEGATYLFIEPNGGWATASSTNKVTGSDARFGSYLGSSVAVRGDSFVAGAPRNGRYVGGAYIFQRP